MLLSELKDENYDSKSSINELHKTWSLRNKFCSKWLTKKKMDKAEKKPINDVRLARV